MCYCTPYEDTDIVLEQANTLLNTYPYDNVVFGVILTRNRNFKIVNDPDSLPSFCGPQGEGWIDVLFVHYCVSRTTDWLISEVKTLSDHRTMT